MDLHIVGAEATEAERQAVDRLLGPPISGWEGGARDNARDGRTARGRTPGHRRRDCCCRHSTRCRTASAGSATARSITSAGDCRCRRPKRGASSLSITCSPPIRSQPTVVHVCDDIACRLHGAEAALSRARSAGAVRSSDRRASANATEGAPRWSPRPASRPRTFVLAPANLDNCRTRAFGALGAVGTWALGAGAAAETDRPGRSVEPRRLSKARRISALAKAIEMGPDRRDRGGDRRRNCWGAAAPRFRPAASGTRWRAKRSRRITSSATPTSRSRARSRIAC